MTVTTLRPSATQLNSGITRTGGSTDHGAMSDDSDATFLSGFNSTGDGVVFTMSDATIPAGALVKSIRARLRSALVAGSHVGQAAVLDVALVASGRPAGQLGAKAVHTITWLPATTVDLGAEFAEPGLVDADVDAITLSVVAPQPNPSLGNAGRVFEAFVDVTHVAQPVADATGPTGTLTTTNLPTIQWSSTLDADGGAQALYGVKVFSQAQYSAGGWHVDDVPVVGTDAADNPWYVRQGSETSWTPTEPLPDGTYRAYVAVGQIVNGQWHFSNWDYVQFTINVALPAIPTISTFPDDDRAMIGLTVYANSAPATTDYLEVERSLDGGDTWQPLRQLQAGLLTPSGGQVNLQDHEAPNGVTVQYRARALHDYSGLLAASLWTPASDTWSSDRWWLKDPLDPARNVPIVVRSFPQVQRAARQGVHQPLGAALPVVVSDGHGPWSGEIVLKAFGLEHQDELAALVLSGRTLLIDAPRSSRAPGYVRVGDFTRARIVDRDDGSRTWDTLAITVVGSPPGDVTGWLP